MVPSKVLPGMFLKSKKANDMWSLAFTRTWARPFSPAQPIIFIGSTTTGPKCASPSNRSIFFSFTKFEKTCCVCSGSVRFFPPLTIFDFRKSSPASLMSAVIDALVNLYSFLKAFQLDWFTSPSMTSFMSGTSLLSSWTMVVFFFRFSDHSFIV